MQVAIVGDWTIDGENNDTTSHGRMYYSIELSLGIIMVREDLLAEDSLILQLLKDGSLHTTAFDRCFVS